MSLSSLNSNIFLPASRLAYLNQIQVLVQQRKIIAIEGSSGIGKTAMLEEALTNVLPDANKSYITASKNINDIQVRSRIIEQLFGNVLFDPEKPLLSSFLEFNHQTQLLIAIDNSHYLSAKLIGELLQLYSGLTQAGINLVIMLAFDKSVSTTLVNLNSAIVAIAPVPAFSKQESYQFLVEHFDDIPPQTNGKVKRWIDSSVGLPIQLLAFNQNTNLRVASNSFMNVKLWVSVIFTASLVISLGLYLYRMNLDAAQLPKVDLTTPSDTQQPNEFDGRTMTKVYHSDLKRAEQEHTATAEDIYSVLIQQAPAEKSEHVVQSEPSKSALDGFNNVVADQASVKVSTLNETPLPDAPPKPSTDNKKFAANSETENVVPNKIETLELEDEVVTESSEALPAVQQTSYYVIDNQSFLSLPSDHYVLQFTAVSSESTLAKYLATAPVSIDDLNIYKVTRNNKDWIVVTHGLFETIKQARSVAEKVEPNAWAKSVVAIQQEINKFNQRQSQQTEQ